MNCVAERRRDARGLQVVQPSKQDTAEMASAFVEDLEHIRYILDLENTVRTESRLLSVTLRRLLVNGEIARIAAPRVGRVVIRTDDLKFAYNMVNWRQVKYFVAGGAKVYGSHIGHILGAITYWRQDQDRLASGMGTDKSTIDLSIDSFVKQRCVYIDNTWLTRGDIIQHVAIYGSAAHSKRAGEGKELVLSRLRNALRIEPDGSGGFALAVDAFWEPTTPDNASFAPSPRGVSGLQCQTSSIASHLASSPDVTALESVIKAELGL
jgi:hypothetical protein